MRKLFFYLQMLCLLTACQTHFPIVSDDITSPHQTSEPIACQENIERIELADIDYLLYANKMIDSMTQSNNVQQKTVNSRMRVYLSPVTHSSDDVDMMFLNTSIKNRILRSGLFIVVEDMESGDFQLSGAFKVIEQQSNSYSYSYSCNQKYQKYQKYEEFSLQLRDSRTDIILWSEKKRFN